MMKRRMKGKVQWKELAAPLRPKVAKPLIMIMIMREIMMMEMIIMMKMVVMMMMMATMMMKITLSFWC